ncbi:glycosyltransferase family 2 protein [Aquincola tertiaricarbonis]|uniref:glycosyltransferase family 2 protein n=1 Tax=Aquincola tertiaricarbonis TaxID=391953 RepID=UPI0006152F9F|nr:glycosyltransferase [Aquincola tertiaricarbonis]
MRLSVIIKTLNEQRNIERAVRSALLAVDEAGGGEVIVADSLSTDDTVKIAARFPVKIVQLVDPSDRCCGVGAQLGYQIAQGEYVYILDGDMEFEADFLNEASKALDANPRLAGVGGMVREMNLDNQEFLNRSQRGLRHMRQGPVDRLDMGGLYRRSALQAVGYFTNRNLHAYEEFELAARLQTAGWRLERLAIPGVKHYGHTESSFKLLGKRWRSRYAWGCGELLRQAWGQAHCGFVISRLHVYRLYGAVLLWMLVVLLMLVLAAWTQTLGWLLAAGVLGVAPVLLMTVRKRSLSRAVYAVSAWVVFAAGLVAGTVRGTAASPTQPVSFSRLQ